MVRGRPLLGNTAYRRLLGAQVVALLGTGLLTVALSLLAFDVAPSSAGAVVATALSIKMVAYVAVAPVLGAVVAGLAPRTVLVGADVVRLGVAACLPWVDEVWQVYALVFVLQAASATFTPAYQALLPSVLPRREDYTRALSWSRLAYDLEAVVSPLLAAVALLVLPYTALFGGTALGFAASAALVLRSGQGREAHAAGASAGFVDRVLAGTRLFVLHRPLRAVLALDLAAAGATATVLVNTVVVAREELGRGDGSVAVALGAFGTGSMLVALVLPRVLVRLDERRVMLAGGAAVALALASTVAVTGRDASWAGLLVLWFLLGAATSAVLTPAGQVITGTVSVGERPAAFAAHFSLSHACFLLAYPVAGWFGERAGVPASVAVLAATAVLATIVATSTWPAHRAGVPADDGRSVDGRDESDDAEPRPPRAAR